ncbi:hypothetical protein MHU86_16660 [Fragilaria crotonensis]|nr:hypothetical protein MHU86_16660 [Fragilaria crotonensis]
MLRIILLGLFVALQAHAFFVTSRNCHAGRNGHAVPFSSRLLEKPREWEGFNPLAKTGAVKSQLLMRKVHMQELTQDIMRNINDDASIQAILENAREFLLEPFESDNAVLDPDSIFEPGMSRAEKFVRYRSIMTKRIGDAKNQGLKKLLQSMMDYVVQFE